ncbi:hypothetical protein PQX77_008940 [Marasmius sp. AFHP31]|nr:hypothetical protein PQX77_008940 [Marasmius sp. AFHP31]
MALGTLALLPAVQNFRRKPPPLLTLDADLLKPDASKAFGSLVTVCEAIQGMSLNTVVFVTSHWQQMWPWLRALSKCCLKKEPTTPEGVELVDKMLYISPILLTYRLYRSDYSGKFRQEIGAILKETPETLGLATELWLLATRRNHQSIRYHCDAVGLLLECYVDAEGSTKTQAKASFEKVLRNPEWDMMGSSLQCIKLFAHPKEVTCYTLRSILFLFNTVTELYEEEFHDISVAKGGIRWSCYVISKLSAPKKRYGDSHLDDVTMCISQCLQYLFRCINRESAVTVQVLDEGILRAMFGSTHLLIYDHQIRLDRAKTSLSANYTKILLHITYRLLYRSILVRVIRAIKKIENLGLMDLGVLRSLPKSVLRAWTQLREEAWKRNAIKKVKGLESVHLRCDGIRCDRVDSVAITRGFKRCGGCRSVFYCSPICQKNAWKEHREECMRLKKEGFKGGGASFSTKLDYAFRRKQIEHDYRESSDRIRELRDQRKVDFPEEQDKQTVVWMYYCDVPVRLEVEERTAALKSIKKDLDETIVVIGVMPSILGDRMPLITFIHSPEVEF